MKVLRLFALGLLVASCSGVKYPTVVESQNKINALQPQIVKYDEYFNARNSNAGKILDVQTSISLPAINKILDKFVSNRTDDIVIKFNNTPKIFLEEKSTLGIKYTNYVDINSGTISVNLKSLKFDSFSGNVISGTIEVEGSGDIGVSGQYMGVPASVKPKVTLYLSEPVQFTIAPTGVGMVTLTPKPKQLKLKTKIAISMLSLNLPWYQEVPLKLEELVKPMQFPIAMQSDFNLPVPSSTFSSNQFEQVPYKFNMSETKVIADKNVIEFKTNVELIKK